MMKFAALAAAALVAGCTAYQPTATAWVRCDGKQCDELWGRAQTWLATNGRYRIQIANDHVIQTYGPHEGVVDAVAYTVTKEKQADGTSKIFIRGHCFQTAYGCMYDPAPYTNALHSALTRQ
jgi:hypothetical protein